MYGRVFHLSFSVTSINSVMFRPIMPIRSLLCIVPRILTASALLAQRSLRQSFSSTFPTGSVSPAHSSDGSSPFIAISPEGSYRVSNRCLELFMQKPRGEIASKGGVNNLVVDGATVNSTFCFLYAKSFRLCYSMLKLSLSMER